MRTLPRFSFGVGDRFGHEATAQLAAFQHLAREGIHVAPVWNKSHREHGFIGSQPKDVRVAAASAIATATAADQHDPRVAVADDRVAALAADVVVLVRRPPTAADRPRQRVRGWQLLERTLPSPPECGCAMRRPLRSATEI